MGTDVVGTGLPWVDAISESFALVPFVDFHRRALPALVEAHGTLVVDDLRGVPPLAFRIDDGTTFTWLADDSGLQVVEGDAGADTLVELSEVTFSEFVHELLTATGAVRTGRARVARGGLAGWERWQPAIQSLCSGREIYGSQVWDTLVDRDGKELARKPIPALDAPLDLVPRTTVVEMPAPVRPIKKVLGLRWSMSALPIAFEG